MLQQKVRSSWTLGFEAGAVWLLVGLAWTACVPMSAASAQLVREKGTEPGDEPDPRSVRPGMNRGPQPRLESGAVPRGLRRPPRPSLPALPQSQDPNKLPESYIVPPEPPEWLTTSEEWIVDPFSGANKKEKDADKKRKLADFFDVLQKGTIPNDAKKQLVIEMVEWHLAQMTLKENRETAFAIREKLLNRVRTSGSSRGAAQDARVLVLQTIVEKAPRLFSYHFVARLNGAIMLADLSDMYEKDQTTHFTRAYVPLIAVLKQVDEQNRKQPEAVRVWAVEGLVRIGVLPEVRLPVRSEIVDAITGQLDESKADHVWLQWRLAEALGTLGIAYNTQREAKVPQALAKVLVDVQRDWLVRAEAAESLGKLPLERDIDLTFLSREVANLAQQMADAYKKSKDRPVWKLAFLKLYLAFKPGTDEKEKTPKGLLTQVNVNSSLSAHKKAVQEAYDVVLPIVQGVLNPGSNLDESVTKLKDWLEKNPRRTTRIADKENPIIEQSSAPPEQPPAGGGSAG